MKTAESRKLPRLLSIGLTIGFCATAVAQEEQIVGEPPTIDPDVSALATTDIGNEELETITIGSQYEEYDEEEEEVNVPDGLIFDAQNQSYRLVEEEPDDWIEPVSEREQDKEELRRLFLLYRDSLTQKAYLEADTLAKRIIELSIRLYGLDSHESAKALTNLAIAQHNNQEFEAAQRNFMATIDIVERIDDNLSAELINPLRGIAATQAATGRADLARASYQRAVHVSHVNEGPHNKSQIQTLESMAELYLSVGEFEDALDMQENIFAIQARKIDPMSPDMLPALEKQAAWQHRLRMYHRERVTWRRVIDILEDEHGKESLLLIPPLTYLGKSYLFVTPVEYEFQPDSSVASGETYLRRANRIAEKDPQADWETVEQTLLSLGDYFVLSGRPNRAQKLYEEAWDLLSVDAARNGNRRTHLESLNVLQDIHPPKYYKNEREEVGEGQPENFLVGSMSFSLSVTPTGRINRIKHLETQPPEIVDFRDSVARSLRHLVYRPRLEERVMVTTPDVIYTHEFFYRLSDVPEPVEETFPDTESPPSSETTN
jgi:hypothetical protein